MKKLYQAIDLVTIIILIALPYYLFEGKLYIGGDDTRLLYSYPFDYLRNFIFFTWTTNSTIGINQPTQFLVPFLSIWSLLNTVIENRVTLSYLSFSFPMILGFIFFKKFTKELFNLDDRYRVQFYLGSLCFILSPILIFDQYFIFLTTVWLLGVIPAIGYYYIKYLRTGSFINVYVSMLIAIVFSIALFSIPWILGLLLPLAAGILVLAYLSKRSEIITVIKRSFIFSIFIFLSQSFWLIGFLIPHIFKDQNSFAGRIASKGFVDTFTPTVLATAKGFIIYPLLNLFHRQIAFDFEWKLKNEFVNTYDQTVYLNFLFVGLIAFGIFSYKKCLDKETRAKYLFILTSLIASLFLFTANIGPLLNVFLFLGKLPGFVMFRNFYDKFAPGYIIIYSILITISLVLIKKRFPNKYIWVNTLTFLVILINFTTIKSTVNAPLWTTNNVYKTINMPPEYTDFMNDIKGNISSTNTILSVPFTASLYSVIKDAESNSVYVGTSPVKLFSGVNDISGDMSFNFTKETDVFSKLIISRSYKDLSEILFRHNVNYILLTKNIPQEVLTSYVFYAGALEKQDKEFLNAFTDGKIVGKSKNGNYVLYEVNNRNTLIASDNLYFKKESPVQYKLYIKNLKKDQALTLFDSFHGGWKLYLEKNPSMDFCSKEITSNPNGVTECKESFRFMQLDDIGYLWKKRIFENTHTTTDGVNNNWILHKNTIVNNYGNEYYTTNPDGSINVEITLYFRPQVYFYYGVMITFVTLLLSTIYLIFKKYKKNENK